MEPRQVKELPATVTHWKQMTDSEFLGAWSIPEGTKQSVTINLLRLEEVIEPETFKRKWKNVIGFDKTDKRMILNKTNLNAIASWHGDEPHKWVGKSIELVRAKTRLGKEMVDCLRIVPNPKKKAEAKSQSAAQSAQ